MARARRNRASHIRSFFLAIVLGALAAWYFYGQPGEDIVKLTDLAGSYLEPSPGESAIILPAAEVTQDVSAAGEPDVTPAVPESRVESVAAAEPHMASDASTLPDAEPSEESIPDAAVMETEAAVEPEPASETPGSTLIQSLVTVYERDGAARIAFRQPVGTTGPLYWWTGDHTAVADTDYIALEQPVVAFASAEEAETLHIPLVNDSLPEPRETFYVFLGQRSIESGRLEPIARIRVDVNDDD